MCYLKNLVQEQEDFDFDDFLNKPEESSVGEKTEEENVLMPCPEKYTNSVWSEDQQKLINLFSLIQRNNSAINSLSKVLGKNSEILEKSSIQIEQQETTTKIEGKNMIPKEEVSPKGFKSSQKLTKKLFGDHQYQYKFKVTEKLPGTLYKERNFNLGIQLVDGSGNIVRNGNVLNLCFAVSTDDGEWILENRVGETFMKGKTEIELVKGEAQFRKLYTRDISRGFPNGKVNIAVYCKPSTLMYTSTGTMETNINYEDIEPLMIKNVTIMAKKKE